MDDNVVKLVHIIERLRDASSEKAAEAEALEVIENPSAIFDLFTIIETNENIPTRQYAIVLIRHLLLKEPHADEEYWIAVKARFLKLIESEPESLLRCNLAHAAIEILNLDSDVVPAQWPELGYFAADMVQNPERLDLGFYLWKQLLHKNDVLLNVENEGILTKEMVFHLALENFTNENQDVRIRAMKYFIDIEWILLDVTADVSEVISTILDAAHNSFYVLRDKDEASVIGRVMGDSFSCVFPFFADLQERIQFAEFALNVITEAELPTDFLVIAANIVNDSGVALLDGQTKEDIQRFLCIAINYTLTMAQADLLSLNFENLYLFIEDISIIEENFVAETILSLARQYKNSNEEFERVTALFLFKATLNGCQEKYATVMNYFINAIIEIISPESDFLFGYGCDLLIQIVEVIPVEMGTKIDKVIEFLWDYVENIKVAQTIDFILDKVPVAPKEAYSYISQFLELLSGSTSEDDQVVIINCIASLLLHIKEPNDEYFTEIGPILMSAIENSSELWECSFRCFRSLITASPAPFISEMETIIGIIMAALQEENQELYLQPLFTLLKIIQFLPISLAPYLDTITQPLLDLFKEQIEADQGGKVQSEDDSQPLGILCHIIGALIGKYPGEFGETAAEVAQIIISSHNGKYNIQMSSLKAIREIAPGCRQLGISLTQCACNLLTELKFQTSKYLISEIYITVSYILTTFYSEITSKEASSLSSKIMVGIDGVLTDFLPFELASSIDPVIASGLYRCINILILLPEIDPISEYSELISLSYSYLKSSQIISGYVCELFAELIYILSKMEPEALDTVLRPAGISTENFVRQIGKTALSLTVYHTTFVHGLRALTYLALTNREDLPSAEFVDPSIGAIIGYLAEESIEEMFSEIPGIFDAFVGFLAAVILTRDDLSPSEAALARWADRLWPSDNGPLSEVAADAAFCALQRWPAVVEPRLPAMAVRVMAMDAFWLARAQNAEAIPALAAAASAVPEEDALRFLGMDQGAMMRLARNLEANSP